MLTQHNKEFRPDPISLLGVGSGHETRVVHAVRAHAHVRVSGSTSWVELEQERRAAPPPSMFAATHCGHVCVARARACGELPAVEMSAPHCMHVHAIVIAM